MSKVSKEKKAELVNTPANNEVVDTATQNKAEKYINEVQTYTANLNDLKQKAEDMFGESIRDTAWKLAGTVWNIVHDEDFKKMFGTQQGLADKIGYSRSAITKMVNAVDNKHYLMAETDIEVDKLSRTQIEEASPLIATAKKENKVNKVVEVFTNIDETTDAKTVRDLCAKAKNELLGKETAPTNPYRDLTKILKIGEKAVKDNETDSMLLANIIGKFANIVLACTGVENTTEMLSNFHELLDTSYSDEYLMEIAGENNESEDNDNE